ncbi:testis-expressed protein 29 [Pogona vitticeps]
MATWSLTITMRTLFRSFQTNPLTKDLEEFDHNLKFLLLMCCLTLWSPVACVSMSLKLDGAIQSPHMAHQLEKRSTNFLRYGFAVCELPFYEICNSNVSRIECSALGCCFHKETCYKKAVPQYMKAFVGLIWLLFGIFCLFLLQSVSLHYNLDGFGPTSMSVLSLTYKRSSDSGKIHKDKKLKQTSNKTNKQAKDKS